MMKTHTTYCGVVFTRDVFIRDYVTNFLATWTAQHFSDFCARNLHAELGRPPWEDALHCAGEAWDHMIEIQP